MDNNGAAWRKSSYSGNNGGECIEVAASAEDIIAVRDSKDPDGTALAFPGERWRAFTHRLRAGNAPH